MPRIEPHPAPHARDLLRALGDAITVGEYWVGPVARQLGVRPQTLRDWLDGVSIPPPGVYAEIAELCARQAAGLDAVSARARAIARDPPAQRRPGRKPRCPTTA